MNQSDKSIPTDIDMAVRMAGALISEAKNGALDKYLLEPEKGTFIDQSVQGASHAEKYLDVSLKDRPREEGIDYRPHHLERPLGALLAFLDDGLPEYSAVKFWNDRKNQNLADKIAGILDEARQFPLQAFNMRDSIGIGDVQMNLPSMLSRWPSIFHNPKALPQKILDQMISRDPQTALKYGLPIKQWLIMDRMVMRNVLRILEPLKNGLPHGLQPEVVPAIVARMKNISYEMLARNYYRAPTSIRTVPIDPEQISAIVMAAPILGLGMDEVAREIPCLFSISSGLSILPKGAAPQYENLFGSRLIPAQVLARLWKEGGISFVMTEALEQKILSETINSAGARPEIIPCLISDHDAAANQPLWAALVVESENFCRKKFKEAQYQIRRKVVEEAKRASAQPQQPTLKAGVDLHVDAEPMETPERQKETIDFPNWESSIPEPPHLKILRESAEAIKRDQLEAQQSANASYTDTPTAGPIRTYLRANPISLKSIKSSGLLREFEAYPDIVTKAGGIDIVNALKNLGSEGLLPKDSDSNDLLNALDNESRAEKRPAPGAEGVAPSPGPREPSLQKDRG